MKTETKKQYTTKELESMLACEIAKYGKHVWSDRRKTIEEMLKIRQLK